MDKLKVGAIGVGGMNSFHCKCYSENPRCEVVCVCDINEEQAAEKAQEFNCDYTTDYKELLARDDVNTISVGVPNPLHYKFALESLRAGKHTSVQYPITQTVREFDTLCEEADSRNLVLHDMLTPWIEPQPLGMRAHVHKVGKVMTMNSTYRGGGIGKWYVYPDKRGNYFSGLTIHIIVYFNRLMAERPDWIDAAYHWEGEGMDARHCASYMCHYPSGALAYNEWGMGFKVPEFSWSVEGAEGRLLYERGVGNNDHQVHLITPDTDEVFELEPQNGVHAKCIDAFASQVLDGNKDCYITRDESRSIIEICEKAAESAEKNQRIYL